MNTQGALKQYKQEMATSEMDDSDPHKLIQMLMEGALKNIAMAKNYMSKDNLDSQEISDKGNSISSAISILDCLQGSLDHDQGGNIAKNLNDLYDYMKMRLVEANSENDATKCEEVIKLLLEIKTAWDQIRDQAVKFLQQREQGQDAGA